MRTFEGQGARFHYNGDWSGDVRISEKSSGEDLAIPMADLLALAAEYVREQRKHGIDSADSRAILLGAPRRPDPPLQEDRTGCLVRTRAGAWYEVVGVNADRTLRVYPSDAVRSIALDDVDVTAWMAQQHELYKCLERALADVPAAVRRIGEIRRPVPKPPKRAE